MTNPAGSQLEDSMASRELVLVRVNAAAPEKLFRAWTEPELPKPWFASRPPTP
jgi:uncharacterized protein YndB with AHSA1/START domain